MGVYIYSVRTGSVSVELNGETVQVHPLCYLTKSASPGARERDWTNTECAYNRRLQAVAEAAWSRRGVGSLVGTIVVLCSDSKPKDGDEIIKYRYAEPHCYDGEAFGETLGYIRKVGRGKWTVAKAIYGVQVGTFKNGTFGGTFHIRETSPIFFEATKAVAWAKVTVKPGEIARVHKSDSDGRKTLFERVSEPDSETTHEVAGILLQGSCPCDLWTSEPVRAQAADALVSQGLVDVHADTEGRLSYRLTVYGLTRLAGLELRSYRLHVELTDTEVVFSGGKCGSHSIARICSSLERVKAHWDGYCLAQKETA